MARTGAVQLDTVEAQALTNLLIDDLEASRGAVGAHIALVRANRELFASVQKRVNPPYDGACELVVPYLRNVRQALIAHYMDQLARREPFFRFNGSGEMGKKLSDNWERFLQRRLAAMEYAKGFESRCSLSLRDGACWGYVTWDEQMRVRRRMQWEQVPSYDPYGQYVGQQESGRRVWGDAVQELAYYGARITNIEIDQAGTFPGDAKSIQDARGVWVRQDRSGDDLLRAVQSGYYSAEAVEHLKTSWKSGDTQTPTGDSQARSISSDDISQTLAFQSQPFQVTECYWRYTPADDDDALTEDWLFCVHEPSKTLLAARPITDNVFVSGTRPLVVCRAFGDAVGVYGDSLGELSGGIQQWLQTLWRLGIDGMALGILPELLFDDTTNPDDIKKYRRERGPGAILPVSRMLLDGGVKPFQGQPLPTFLPSFLEAIQREGDKPIGANDAMSGQSVSGADTAYEVNAVLAQGQKVLTLQSEHIAMGEEAIARHVCDLLYQYQTHPEIARQWRQANPDDYGDLFEAMDLLADEQFTISMAGLREYMSSQQRQKVNASIWQLLTDPNSVIAQVVASDGRKLYRAAGNLLRSMGDSLDVESIIGTEEEWLQFIQMRQQQAQMAQEQQALQSLPPEEPTPEEKIDEQMMSAFATQAGKRMADEGMSPQTGGEGNE